MNFKAGYFLLAILLFLTEAWIAAYMHDAFIRPVFGDFLVVILLYCILKCFVNLNYVKAALLVLLIAYAIEVSQYFHLIAVLGWSHSLTAQLILGSGFSWGDMLAYTLGTLLVLIIERLRVCINFNNQSI